MHKQHHHAAASPGRVAGLEMTALAKITLIRNFQRSEGNFDCCASPYARVCKQYGCLWRDDCLAMTQG